MFFGQESLQKDSVAQNIGSWRTCLMFFGQESWKKDTVAQNMESWRNYPMFFGQESRQKDTVAQNMESWIAWYKSVLDEGTKDALILTEGIYVTYNYEENGGTSWTGDSLMVPVRKGEEIDLTPMAEKEGYDFVGWNFDKDATTGLSASDALTAIDDVNEDVTLYAIYKKDVTVTYHTYEESKDYEDVVSFYNNTTSVSYKIPEYKYDDEYNFVGFSLDKKSTDDLKASNDEIELSIDNADLYCVYGVKGILQYYDMDGVTLLDQDTIEAKYVASDVKGAKFAYNLRDKIAKDGYRFIGWVYKDKLYKSGDSISSSEAIIKVIAKEEIKSKDEPEVPPTVVVPPEDTPTTEVPPVPNTPATKTGDNTSIVLISIIMLASLFGFILLRKKNK